MAILASVATGDFTNSATWAVCDPTAALDPITGLSNTNLTTSYVASSAFTPGIITVAGIIVKIHSRGTVPSGTMSVELYNSTAGASVAGTEVTINVADLPFSNSNCGTAYFKFSAPVVLLVATNYQVRAKTSTTNQISLNHNATANNWVRQLVTTTNQAPAAGDNTYINTEYISAGVNTPHIVTMNETATTAYGSVQVGISASLIYGTSAATNYYLRCQHVVVGSGATLKIGDSGTPIPSTSTAVLEFNCASSGQYGLNLARNSNFITQGATKNNYYSLMTANKNAAATSISVASTADWAVGDVLVFSPTRSSYTEFETKNILTVDSPTDFTLTAGLSSYKSGTAPTQAEVGNVTRNVMIRGISEALGCWIMTGNNNLTINCRYTHFRFLNTAGVSVFGNVQAAIFLQSDNTVGVSVLFEYCSFTETVNNLSSFCLNTNLNFKGEISRNVFYKHATAIIIGNRPSATNDDCIIEDNIIINCSNSSNGGLHFTANAGGARIDGNRISGCVTHGLNFNDAGSVYKIDNNIMHSNQNVGIRIANLISMVSCLDNTVYRNGGSTGNFALTMVNQVGTAVNPNIIIDGLICFGGIGSNPGVYVDNYGLQGVYFIDCTIDAGSTADGGNILRDAIATGSTCVADAVQFVNCSIGQSQVVTNLFSLANGTPRAGIVLNNCLINATNEFQGSSQSSMYGSTGTYTFRGLISLNHNQVSGSNRRWTQAGRVSTDTVIFDGSAPSVRLTPITASKKLSGPFKMVPVINGGTVTVSVNVRKSVIGDGTAYNGAQPRLMVKTNPSLGINSDTVLATMTAAAGTWEELTGTTIAVTSPGTLEFYVDCDGTTGWVNVDNFTTTSKLDSTDTAYWDIYGNSYMIDQGGAGGSFPFC